MSFLILSFKADSLMFGSIVLTPPPPFPSAVICMRSAGEGGGMTYLGIPTFIDALTASMNDCLSPFLTLYTYLFPRCYQLVSRVGEGRDGRTEDHTTST